MREWTDAVHRDASIQRSERISCEQLRNHLPNVLDDLSDLLRRGPHGEPQDKERDDAAAHGFHRWEQGYDLRELLRETGHLRRVLIDKIQVFREHAGVPGEELLSPVQTIHWSLDRLIWISTEQFVEEQERALREQSAKVHELSEARWRLMRTISHELRNSLNSVSLTAQHMPLEEDPAERVRDAQVVKRNVDHMRGLLDQLLDFSGLLSGAVQAKVKAVDLGEFVEELTAVYQVISAAKGLTFSSASDPAARKIHTDPGKLRQVATNLLDNAIKYTNEGSISFRCEGDGADRWCMVVEDTGRGISEEEQARLFQEFYRVPGSEREKGTGLGLAITKELVGVLGGTIRVESRPGHGSRFVASFLSAGPGPSHL